MLTASIFAAAASAAAAAAPADDSGLSPQATLTTGLTVEGLLFAALAISYRFHLPTESGRAKWMTGGPIGGTITFAIACAAVAAGAGWWATFSPDWPDGINEWMRAAPLTMGIIIPPVIALVVTIAGASDTESK